MQNITLFTSYVRGEEVEDKTRGEAHVSRADGGEHP